MREPQPEKPVPSDESSVKKKKKRKRESVEATITNPSDKSSVKKKKKRKRESAEATITNNGRDDEALGEEGEGGGTEIQSPELSKKKKKERKNEKSDDTNPVQFNIGTGVTSYQEDQTEEKEDLTLLYKKDIQFQSCGLVNFGRTCYANVILQCLLHIRPLMAYISRVISREECVSVNKDWCLLCALGRHARSLQGSCSQARPTEIIEHVTMIAGPDFKLSKEHDAAEFLMHNGKKVEVAETIINHIFCGEFCSKVRCRVCKSTSRRYELLQTLTVPIGFSPTSLEECLSSQFESERIELFDCTVCNKKVNARRRLSIDEAPNLLTICLSRFASSGKKLKHTVSYPMTLDMADFMNGDNNNHVYDLYAVVVHVDIGKYGHYRCYVKNYEGNWSMFDDAKVKVVPMEVVKNQEAYVLLYIRRIILPKPLPLELYHEQNRKRPAIGPVSFPWSDEKKKTKGTMDTTTSRTTAKPSSPKQVGVGMMSPPLHKKYTSPDDLCRKSYYSVAEIGQAKRSLDTFGHLDDATKARLREMYWINEDTEKEVVLEKIKDALEGYDKTGQFTLPSRGKDSHVFDIHIRSMFMHDKGVYQTKSALKAKRLADSMHVVRKHLLDDMLIQNRAIYYLNTELYGSSANSDDIVAALCSLLRCTRQSLNVTVSSTGSIAGPVVFYIKGGIIIDCWRSGVAGCKIPDEAYSIAQIVSVKQVRFILVVEKETVFRLLTGLRFPQRYHCVIITGSGQPDIVTRFVVWLLRRTLKVKVYGFADANPSGVLILCTYKFGSQKRSSDNVVLVVSDLVWVGLQCSDFEAESSPRPLTEKNVLLNEVKKGKKAALKAIEDAKKAGQKAIEAAKKAAQKAMKNQVILKNLLKLKHIQDEPEWHSRITEMLRSGKTADIERVLNYTNVTEYFEKRIPEMKAVDENDADKAKGLQEVDNGKVECEDEGLLRTPLATKTRPKVYTKLKFEDVPSNEFEDVPSNEFEDVPSNDDNKMDNSNTRKRKGKSDSINQDPASQVKKSKKKKSAAKRDGLIIEDLSQVASKGKTVYIDYVAEVKGVTVQSSNEIPEMFTLGSEEVIPGWNHGIDGMHVGDTRKLTVKPSMRKTGSKPLVEEMYKKSTITYFIKLMRLG